MSSQYCSLFFNIVLNIVKVMDLIMILVYIYIAFKMNIIIVVIATPYVQNGGSENDRVEIASQRAPQ